MQAIYLIINTITMPIYEYNCPHCDTNFEEWLKVSEADSVQQCPECGKDAQRFVSQTSFVLKGSGWYVTEYGKDSASSSPQNKNGGDSAEKSSESKTESPVSKDNASASSDSSASAKSSETSQSSGKKEAKSPKAEPAHSKQEKNTTAATA